MSYQQEILCGYFFSARPVVGICITNKVGRPQQRQCCL